MRSLLIVIALAVVCTCLPGKYISAQKVVVSFDRNFRHTIDLSSGNCTPSPWTNFCTTTSPVTSIGMIRDTLYYLSGGILYQQSFMDIATTCGKYLSGISSDVLTVDKRGMVYWVSNSLLIKLDPYLHILDTLGTLPVAATGDMIFYKDRLYLSATGGIVEVDTANPSQSRMVIPAPGREFSGLVNVGIGCSGNKVYAFEFVNGSNNVIELDLEQNRILGTQCSFNFNGHKVIDAASFNETGELPGITVKSILVKPSCWPETDKSEVRITAFTPSGDSSLQYTFTKGNARISIRPARGPAIISNQMDPGIWRLTIVNDNSCSLDTQFVVPDPVKLAATVDTTPDTCNMGKGSAIVKIISGTSPYEFIILGVGSQTTPIFTSLQSGAHKIQVNDSNSCSIDLAFTIGTYTQPAPVKDITIVPVQNCNVGGEIKITYDPSANISGTRLGDNAFQASSHFTNVPAGTHRVQIQMGSCVFDTLIIMPAAPAAAPVIRFNNRSVDCNGGGGSSTLQVTNIIPPFTVSFNGGGFAPGIQFTNLAAGVYPVVVKDANGCEWKASDTVHPYRLSPPLVDSAINNDPCQGRGNIRLAISGTETPYRFEVNGSLYNSGMRSADLASGTYPLIIYNALQCAVDTLQFTIPAKIDCDTIHAIYVPSAFTPNGDGKNDILEPLGNPSGKVTHFVFRVYNRSGQVVFETRTPRKGWDGKFKGIQQPSAVYVWVFQGTDPDGKPVIFKGTTLLLR
jgi:gliding motility-associated-like protein